MTRPFRVLIECPDGVMKWLPEDLLDGTTDLQTLKGRAYLASAVMKTVKEQMARIENESAKPRPVETCQDTQGHTHGHNCFADENEYIVMAGNSIGSSCSQCGFIISAG